MLGNFTYCTPTERYFGGQSLEGLHKELPKYGDRVVLIYGGGSIKRNGIYDAVRAILPAGVWFQPRDRYTLAENAAWDDRWRNPAAQAVFQTLQTPGGAAEESALRAQFEAEALQRALQYLRQKKLVTCETSHRRRVNAKTERIAVLAVPAAEARRFAQSPPASAPVPAAAMALPAPPAA